METNLTYDTVYSELAQIAREIETESISVDVMAQKVKRASELVTLCQAKLKNTEAEVNRIIAKMEGEVIEINVNHFSDPQNFKIRLFTGFYISETLENNGNDSSGPVALITTASFFG